MWAHHPPAGYQGPAQNHTLHLDLVDVALITGPSTLSCEGSHPTRVPPPLPPRPSTNSCFIGPLCTSLDMPRTGQAVKPRGSWREGSDFSEQTGLGISGRKRESSRDGSLGEKDTSLTSPFHPRDLIPNSTLSERPSWAGNGSQSRPGHPLAVGRSLGLFVHSAPQS